MTDSVDSERAWLERELTELRGREAQYRERLGYKETLSARLYAYSESLHQLFRRRPPSRLDLTRTLVDVARLSGQALGIARPSVWLFDATRERLRCVVQLDEGKDVVVNGLELKAADYPSYIDALVRDSAVAVHDVFDDPRTKELTAYCREHGVRALLDIPIVVPGSLLGVVCHEHVAGPRRWDREEIEFASGVGNVVALALEAERRNAAEHAAMGTEAKYRHLVETLPVVVYSIELPSRRLEYVSPRVYEFGASVDDLLRRGASAWHEHIYPEDRGPVLDRLDGGAGRGFPPEITYRVRMPNGATRWVRDTCSVVRDHAGNPIAIQGVLADVSAQREADLSRDEFERRFRTLLENVDEPALTLDRDGRATFVNDAFVRMSGFSREEVLGKEWFQLMIPPSERDQLRARFRQGVENGTLMPRVELGIVTRTGEARHVLCANVLLKEPQGGVAGVATIAIDMTDRRRLETELLQQTKVESLGRLAASVAHDFNNLLTIVMAEVGLLERQFTRSAAEDRFDAINAALHQAAELTRSLLTYGRKQKSATHRVVVDELLRNAVPLFEAIAGRAISVKLSLHADGAVVKLDDMRLRQAVLNLVGNATDATREHGSCVGVTTHLELLDETLSRRHGVAPGREFVVMTISDDGRGMDERTLAQIFDPFFTTKQGGRGTGLGLAITHTVVAQAGGFVTVESAPSAGTTFRIYLPTADGMAPSVPAPSAPATARTGQKRVLVVDDADSIREYAAALLRQAGYDVVTASGTRSAAEALSAEWFDALITDVSLLDGSGAVLARSARAIRPELPIVLMTGTDEVEDEFDGTLSKPFDEATLVAAVTKAIAAHGVPASH